MRELPLAMTLPRAKQIIGSDLGEPSKMPGRAWGISAHACKRAQELIKLKDSICGRCYAKRGRYLCNGPREAHARRLEGLEHPQWAEALAFLINVYGERHFRWFDSGDLQSVEHLRKICDVARRTPSTRHWIPTHEPHIVGDYLGAGGSIPSNLVIRISADLIEDYPRITHGLPTSTVHRHKGEPVPVPRGRARDSIECKAHERGNRCGQCRACWDPRVPNVSYPLK